jgi:hypothetical protein
VFGIELNAVIITPLNVTLKTYQVALVSDVDMWQSIKEDF